MVMPIHLYGTKVWEVPAKKITKFDDKLVGLIRDMFETMHNADGIGLAANQVGLPLSLAVMDISVMEDYASEKPLVVINPEIIGASGKYVMEEGCLSVPGVRDEVTRADALMVRYTDGNFERVERELTGMWARVFQHEYDHLQQKFFVNRLTAVKRQMVKPRLARIKRNEIRTRYPVVSAADEKTAR